LIITIYRWAMTRAAKRAEEAMAEIASTGKTSYKGSSEFLNFRFS